MNCTTCGGSMLVTGWRDPMTKQPEPLRFMACGRENQPSPKLGDLMVPPHRRGIERHEKESER